MNHTEDRRVYDKRLDDIEEKLDKLSKDVEDLVSAWKAANVVVSFVKWIGGVVATLTTVYSILRIKG